MKLTDAGDVADVAFDEWRRTGLHVRYGAVRLTRDRRCTSRAAPAARSRPRHTEDGNPALGLALAIVVSGLFWAALAVAARALWG
jgi:hypothetical protein